MPDIIVDGLTAHPHAVVDMKCSYHEKRPIIPTHLRDHLFEMLKRISYSDWLMLKLGLRFYASI
jgi:hypothetical protein